MTTATTTRLCPDCGVQVNEQHTENCDVARCLMTGHQRLSCFPGASEEHDCGLDVWTGEWPGTVECREYGLWAKLVPGEGWQPCTADTAGASPDLNTLFGSGRFEWNQERRRWVPKGPDTMSSRIEMANAADVSVEIAKPGATIGEDTLTLPGVIFWYGEDAFVIEGTKEQLLDRLNRARRNVEKLR